MAKDLRPELLAALVEAKDASPGLAWFADDLRGHFDFSEVEVTLPNHLIDGDVELEVGGTRVRLLSVGPAHTAGDVLVHLPEDDVVFAGDVIFRGCTPLGWEGTFASWIAALERILALAPAVIVPGHGPLCGPEGARGADRLLPLRRARGARAASSAASRSRTRPPRSSSAPTRAGTSPSASSSTWRAPTASCAAARPTNRCPPTELLDLAVKVRPRLRR